MRTQDKFKDPFYIYIGWVAATWMIGNTRPTWLASKICQAKDLASKGCQKLGKNICHRFDKLNLRY
jgi:hypothetical protein